MKYDDALKALWYSLKTGFTSLSKFWVTVKKSIPDVSYLDVKTFLARQEAQQITKQVQRPKEFSNIISNQFFFSTQMDVCVYDRYKIDNYKYILGVIDVFSRYAVCRALTNEYKLR